MINPPKMEYPQNSLEDYHEHIRLLRFCEDALSSLASAFDMTGNSNVAENLWRISGDITTSRNGVENFVGNQMDERLKDSQEMTKAVIGAALAGITASRKSPKLT